MRGSRLLSLCPASAAAVVLLAAAEGGAVVEAPRAVAPAAPVPPAAPVAPAVATEAAAGHAQAVLARLVPYVGLPGVAASVGFTAAQVENGAARASAAAADLGLLGTLVGASAGDKAPALPSPVNADSGGTQKVERVPFAPPGTPAAPADPTAPGVGPAHELAQATEEPLLARGVTTGPTMRVPGFLEVSGGSSRSESTADKSVSEVTIGSLSLGAGAVVLNGLRWTAQQVGAAPATATFDLGGMVVNGQAIPLAGPDGMADAVTTANGALAPLGLALSVPTKTAGASGGAVAPLVVQARNPESAVGPSAQAGDVTKPVIAELTKAIIAANPDAAAAQIVLNAVTGAAGGRTGGRLELGGVSARFARLAAADGGTGGLLPAGAALPSLPPAGGAGAVGAPGAPGASAATFVSPAADGAAVLPGAGAGAGGYDAGAAVPSGVADAGALPALAAGASDGTVVAQAAAGGIDPTAAAYASAGDSDRTSTSVALALGLLAVVLLAIGDRIRIRRLTR